MFYFVTVDVIRVTWIKTLYSSIFLISLTSEIFASSLKCALSALYCHKLMSDVITNAFVSIRKITLIQDTPIKTTSSLEKDVLSVFIFYNWMLIGDLGLLNIMKSKTLWRCTYRVRHEAGRPRNKIFTAIPLQGTEVNIDAFSKRWLIQITSFGCQAYRSHLIGSLGLPLPSTFVSESKHNPGHSKTALLKQVLH